MTGDLGGRVVHLVEQLRQAWRLSQLEDPSYRPLQDLGHLRYLELVRRLYAAELPVGDELADVG